MIKIANAPCSWGVDYADDINNPKWEDVFKDISKAGYKYCEIGPYGFLPNDSNKTLDFLIKEKYTRIFDGNFQKSSYKPLNEVKRVADLVLQNLTNDYVPKSIDLDTF